ncbi:uncharacterized protein G2W53_029908 [Senna tora]|uniref:Uncharacterized protein n=1 Tax=Senna tora TaxID=362788 RepID=A0A834TEX1_9FABA|nr:uncharacterized protein G2W53_029908 [Senna tora]
MKETDCLKSLREEREKKSVQFNELELLCEKEKRRDVNGVWGLGAYLKWTLQMLPRLPTNVEARTTDSK